MGCVAFCLNNILKNVHCIYNQVKKTIATFKFVGNELGHLNNREYDCIINEYTEGMKQEIRSWRGIQKKTLLKDEMTEQHYLKTVQKI